MVLASSLTSSLSCFCRPPLRPAAAARRRHHLSHIWGAQQGAKTVQNMACVNTWAPLCPSCMPVSPMLAAHAGNQDALLQVAIVLSLWFSSVPEHRRRHGGLKPSTGSPTLTSLDDFLAEQLGSVHGIAVAAQRHWLQGSSIFGWPSWGVWRGPTQPGLASRGWGRLRWLCFAVASPVLASTATLLLMCSCSSAADLIDSCNVGE